MIETRKTYRIEGWPTTVSGPWVRDHSAQGPYAENTARGYATADARDVFERGHKSVTVETSGLDEQGNAITYSLVIPTARILGIGVESRTR